VPPAGWLIGLCLLAPAGRAQEAGPAAPPLPVSEQASDDEAQGFDDEDLVVVVQTKDGRVPRAAGSAHVVDEEELEQFEYDDVHRVLSRVPGVYLRGEDGFGLRPNIGLRGANSDRSAKVTLMEDGILFGPAPYAAPAAYYFPMSTRLVGVEVFKGPAATRFGPSTVGGAINLRTRSVPRDGSVGQLDMAVGLRNTFKAHGYAGVGGPRSGVLVEGVSLGTSGFKDLDGGGSTGFVRQELMAKTFWASDPAMTIRHRLELKAGYSRERSDETYLGLTLQDFEQTPYRRYAASALDQMRWHRSQAALTWAFSVGQRIELRTTAYHHYFTRQWFKLNRVQGVDNLHDLLLADGSGEAAVYQDLLRGAVDSEGPEQQLWLGTNDRRYQAAGLQVDGRVRGGWGWVNSETRFGVRLHFDDVLRRHTEAPYDIRDGLLLVDPDAETVTTLDSTSQALAFSAHVTEDLGLGPVRVLPGVRLEVIRTNVAFADGRTLGPVTRVVPLPGVGVHGSVLSWFDLFAGVHRGFSPVAPGQDPDVRPESSINVEAGLRLSPGETYVEAVGFYNDYDNLSGQCTFSGGCTDDQVGKQFNGGRVAVYGLEALLAQGGAVGRGVRLEGELTYTFTGSRFRTGFVSGFPQFGTVEIGDALPYVPEHQGGARLTLTHPYGHVTLGATARSAMRDVASQGPIPDAERVEAMGVLDLGIGVHAGRHADLYATVNNVANAVYVESLRPFGLRPGMPIQAMFGVKLHGARDPR